MKIDQSDIKQISIYDLEKLDNVDIEVREGSISISHHSGEQVSKWEFQWPYPMEGQTIEQTFCDLEDRHILQQLLSRYTKITVDKLHVEFMSEIINVVKKALTEVMFCTWEKENVVIGKSVKVGCREKRHIVLEAYENHGSMYCSYCGKRIKWTDKP